MSVLMGMNRRHRLKPVPPGAGRAVAQALVDPPELKKMLAQLTEGMRRIDYISIVRLRIPLRNWICLESELNLRLEDAFVRPVLRRGRRAPSAVEESVGIVVLPFQILGRIPRETHGRFGRLFC